MSRMDKVQKEIRQQVSLIVQQELQDPRMGFITITRAEVTPDLRQARIFFTTFGIEDPIEDAADMLNRTSGVIRRLLGERIRMKFTPTIDFFYDESQRKCDKIEEIIERIKKEKETDDADK
ncbi:MAG: 30S ribosome-binding factor RbfA [Candidatus Omnitrophica bacterium]|nr:30S ribosome-binding factor RbfA [Candidatus Omnitrophota bacterium]